VAGFLYIRHKIIKSYQALFMETSTPAVAKKPFYKRKWVWLVGVIVLFIIGSSGSDNKPQVVDSTGSPSESSAQTEEKTTYKVGESIKLKKSIITVNEFAFSLGSQFSKPTEGNQWVEVNLTIENTDSAQQFVTTLGQMFVRDAEGNSYQVAVNEKAMSNPNNRLDGAIIANSKRTGWVGFEIPKDATGLQFQYNGSMWGGGTILVDLQ
jgi:hypothetical protein